MNTGTNVGNDPADLQRQLTSAGGGGNTVNVFDLTGLHADSSYPPDYNLGGGAITYSNGWVGNVHLTLNGDVVTVTADASDPNGG